MPNKGKSTRSAASAKKSAATGKAKAAEDAAPAKKAAAPKAAKSAKASKPAQSAGPVNGRTTPLSDDQLSAFTRKQKYRLLELKDSLMDSMTSTANDTLRTRAEGSEASAFGMHQADAGTDAYDRDFALNLLSQEQDALYEIEEALKRIENGTYGICEMSGRKIPQARLEALPFARFTVECQQQVEKEMGPGNARRSVRSLFGLMGSDDEDEETEEDPVDKDVP